MVDLTMLVITIS